MTSQDEKQMTALIKKQKLERIYGSSKQRSRAIPNQKLAATNSHNQNSAINVQLQQASTVGGPRLAGSNSKSSLLTSVKTYMTSNKPKPFGQ